MSNLYQNLELDNFPKEEWKDVENYEGLYQVSNLGKVKSLKDNNGKPREKIMKQEKTKNGYLRIMLCKNGKRERFLVHRLVAQAFLENPSNLPCVNHIDENKENNQVDNLEWCTYQYNLTYGTCQQRRVENTDWKVKVANTDYKAIVVKIDYKAIGRKNAEKLSRQVFQYTLDGELVAIWQSTRECGRNGFNLGAVAACCRNCFNREGNNVYKGFIWSYTELNKKQD